MVFNGIPGWEEALVEICRDLKMGIIRDNIIGSL